MPLAYESVPLAITPAPVVASARYRRLAIAIVLLGLAIRLVIASSTLGTNDTLTWQRFGRVICAEGLVASYVAENDLNHPPLTALWAALSFKLAGEDTLRFALLMRLPAIAGDLLAFALLWRIGLSRFTSERTALALVAAAALNPVLIFISSFHTNTDNLYAALILLALTLGGRQRPLLAGLAMGAAMNVKIIPLLLLPALLTSSRRATDALKMLAGFAMPLALFIVPTLATHGVFFRRLFLYKSNAEHWGILLLIRMTEKIGVDPQTVSDLAWRYFDMAGKWIMLTMILLAAAWSSRKKATPETAGALAACMFLCFAPGFGVQYLALPAVLILAASLRGGVWFAGLGGAFLFMVYFMYLDEGDRFRSFFITQLFAPTVYVGLIPWAVMLIFVAVTMWTGRRPCETNEAMPDNV